MAEVDRKNAGQDLFKGRCTSKNCARTSRRIKSSSSKCTKSNDNSNGHSNEVILLVLFVLQMSS